MAKGYLLGIDIGTYESKGVITDLDGKVLSTQVNPHTMSIPHQGWAEHDAEKDWWGDFCIITKKLLADTGIDPKEIIAVGCSAIGSDCLPVDKDCKPLRMGILYGVDTRNMNEITELDEKWGKDKIFEHGGMELATQMVGPKILWVKKNEPKGIQIRHCHHLPGRPADGKLCHRPHDRILLHAHVRLQEGRVEPRDERGHCGSGTAARAALVG